MVQKRKIIPVELVQQVLFNSKRRCCICHEQGNDEVREGAIARLVPMKDMPTIETEENLAFLCSYHHKMLDSGQLTEKEVREARNALYRSMAGPHSMKSSDPPWQRYLGQVHSLLVAEFEREFHGNVTVHFGRSYPGKSGCLREADISATVNVAGLRILIVVEVKSARKSIGVSEIESFSGLLQDINANKGLFVASGSFSELAVQRAKSLGIALATIRKDDSDFKAGIILDPIISVDDCVKG
jgi:hypothetical protein